MDGPHNVKQTDCFTLLLQYCCYAARSYDFSKNVFKMLQRCSLNYQRSKVIFVNILMLSQPVTLNQQFIRSFCVNW